MTSFEYARLYRLARASYPKLTRAAMRNIARVYEQAAANVAEIVRRTTEANLSELTSGAWRQIQMQLEREAEIVREAIRAGTQYVVEGAGNVVTEIDEKYLFSVVDKSSGAITQTGIVNMMVSVNRKLVASLVNRIYQDGYTFSERIWKIAEGFSEDIKRVVTTGITAGRDVIQIARDLEVYVNDGYKALAKRYGALTSGTKEWVRRVRKDVDYNALRLVRSELYQSIQDASVLSAERNPACTQEFDWIRNTTENWNCDCPDLAAGGPYTKDEIPDYPHPQCLCTIRPVLMDGNEFLSDMKKWANGEDVGYIDEWYQKYYSQSA